MVPDYPQAATAHDGYLRLLVQEDAAWMARGACRGSDPELFFPVTNTGRSVEQIVAAKAVCGRCPVSRQCLSYAQRTLPDGIWGGTTREERIARRTRAAADSSGYSARALDMTESQQ